MYLGFWVIFLIESSRVNVQFWVLSKSDRVRET
jgi:hypothetical protein